MGIRQDKKDLDTAKAVLALLQEARQLSMTLYSAGDANVTIGGYNLDEAIKHLTVRHDFLHYSTTGEIIPKKEE